MLSLEQAQSQILKQPFSCKTEEMPLDQAFGRVIAGNYPADRDYPPFNRAAMDGFAVKAGDICEGAVLNIIDTVYAGQVSEKTLQNGQCMRIMTGAPLPDGADAVVRVEETETTGGQVTFHPAREVKSGANFAKQGEDAAKGSIIVPQGSICSPSVAGTLASVGQSAVRVSQNPSFGLISTGNELKAVDEPVAPHQIRDSNACTLQALFAQYSMLPEFHERVQDHEAALEAAIRRGMKLDILVLTGGVSMGDADLVPYMLKKNGAGEVFHKAAIKPGKPIWFGVMPGGGLIFALPGNPFSCQVGFKLFIEPMLRQGLGLHPFNHLYLPMAESRSKKNRLDHFFPCRIITSEGRSMLKPIPFNGSGDIRAGNGSDGLARQQADKMTLQEGEWTEFMFW